MKFGFGSLVSRLAVRVLMDPVLQSERSRRMLRSQVYKEHPILKFALRHVVDPTVLPPPTYTRKRANAVIGESLRRCVEFVVRNQVPGDFLEFGTLLGYSARWLATLMREHSSPGGLWLYDSFEGLPDLVSEVDLGSYEVASHRGWFKGAMKVDPGIDGVVKRSIEGVLSPERVKVVKGYYEETLMQHLPTEPAALVHIDCDLYASAKFVLERLIGESLLQAGTLLILDDYNCNRASPSFGERRALVEAFAAQKRYTCSPWFSYGWHGQVFFVHDENR